MESSGSGAVRRLPGRGCRKTGRRSSPRRCRWAPARMRRQRPRTRTPAARDEHDWAHAGEGAGAEAAREVRDPTLGIPENALDRGDTRARIAAGERLAHASAKHAPPASAHADAHAKARRRRVRAPASALWHGHAFGGLDDENAHNTAGDVVQLFAQPVAAQIAENAQRPRKPKPRPGEKPGEAMVGDEVAMHGRSMAWAGSGSDRARCFA